MRKRIIQKPQLAAKVEAIAPLLTLFVVANANGLHFTLHFLNKPHQFYQYLLNSGTDFAFVSEIHFTPTNNP